MKALRACLWLGLMAALIGCATPDPYATMPRTGDPYTDAKYNVTNGPARDRVMWEYRAAAAALRRGLYGEAKPLLDDALLTIGGIYGNVPDAKRARSYFHEEARKTFLGEPYERVMAYYYRGLLYWRDGEPDNARACFRSAQIQDADTENKEYSSDYMLLDYLDGLATAKLQGDGSDAFKRAKSLAKLAIPPDYDPKANVLFFLDYGSGPAKYATGEYGEQLRFLPGQSLAREVMITVAGQLVAHVGPYDDLTFQATTRGGRVMDYILGNKAVFKKSTDVAGDVALVSGAVLATDRRTDEAGLGLLAFGLLSKIVSATTKPAADVRAWDNLPQYLSLAAVSLPPGPHVATVEFLDEKRQPISSLTKTINFTVPSSARDTVIYVNDQSLTPQNL
jgi:tetratricopeptide (TPR) repeat protein